MSNQNEIPRKFRPERPIYLNEDNIGVKTKNEVLFAIEKLRAQCWLVCYGEKSRPFHMSFLNEKEFREFKKCCKDLGISLKQPNFKLDEIEELESQEKQGQIMPEATATASYEDPDGKIHIGE